MATKAQVEAFIAKIAPLAQKQAKAHGNKIFASVCIAQACCESAYGTSKKMAKANAVFGIKVGKSKYHFGTAWKDKAYSSKTNECYDGKTYTQITDMFRAYDSLEDSVTDYFDLLCVSSRYKYALNQPTPLACIQGIQKAPYATSPTYVNTIMSIINKYGLTKYDSGSTAAPATPVTPAVSKYYPKYTGKTTSIVTALKAVNADSSYSNRKKIAAANSISPYSGTPAQNTRMLKLLKEGKLIKP